MILSKIIYKISKVKCNSVISVKPIAAFISSFKIHFYSQCSLSSGRTRFNLNNMSVSANCAGLPSLYEYYTTGGISSGLSSNQSYFTLNDKNVSIYSGAMHYFRVPQEYWRDRLRKMRHAGLNTVETYVPWNLHEPEQGKFDFGEGGTDWQDFLNIEKFLKTAQEEDLFAIVRSGPFICAEWEFGGFPSWLLREENIKVRTSDSKYMAHVRRFFNTLLPILAALQFTSGGPIIAFQIENEYGSTERKTKTNPFIPDLNYVDQLIEIMHKNKIKELLFSSDSPTAHGTAGTIPSKLLQTANFNNYPEKEFDKLKQLQHNRPTMAMEFWSGWFDHWFENHYKGDVNNFADVYERILKYPASVNLYMFHGGTSFGFLNGANIKGPITQPVSDIQTNYQPDITSYDYDAPLTEYGGYNPKYFVVKRLLEKYNTVKTRLPPFVPPPQIQQYPQIKIVEYIPYECMIGQIPTKLDSKQIIPMELLPINNDNGQSYGYVVYRKSNVNLRKGSKLKIKGYIYDSALIFVNNQLISKPLKKATNVNEFGFYRLKDGSAVISNDNLQNATVDVVVENMGRNNFGQLEWFQQFKGLHNNIYIDDTEITNYQISPLEFKKSWTEKFVWRKIEDYCSTGLYKGILTIDRKEDTFLDMRKWTRGIVIVNGFVLGRYSIVGPQLGLYLPGPSLKLGQNDIVIFEYYQCNDYVEFSKIPLYV